PNGHEHDHQHVPPIPLPRLRHHVPVLALPLVRRVGLPLIPPPPRRLPGKGEGGGGRPLRRPMPTNSADNPRVLADNDLGQAEPTLFDNTDSTTETVYQKDEDSGCSKGYYDKLTFAHTTGGDGGQV